MSVRPRTSEWIEIKVISTRGMAELVSLRDVGLASKWQY